MSGPQPGFLASYNSLTDKHLVGYFSNTRIRRHLQRSGLISRSGRIIPEKEYQLNNMKRDHQKYVQERLTQAICHKVLDIQRRHQLETKKNLENSARKERVQKIRVEQSRRPVEGASPKHCPHPPLGPRNHYRLCPLVAGEPAGHSQRRAPGPVVDYEGGRPSHQHRSKEPAFPKIASYRPNTAPENEQHPRRLQPLRSCVGAGSVPKTSSSKRKCCALENDEQSASGGERSGLRLKKSMEYESGVPPCQLPIINSYFIPVPPPAVQKGDKNVNAMRNGTFRGRRYRPTTASNGLEQLLTKNSGGFPKPSLHSNAFVTMVFLGKSVHLSRNNADYRDEINIYQQHCGGENLCVYKGKLLPGETFQFVSKRHHGFPFSLTFFLNGIQVDRLSCCCEYKHQKRSRLGGRNGYFGFLNVEGASPCYRCIITTGLDKVLSPPKRKLEDHEEKRVGSWRDRVRSEPSKSSVERKSSKGSVLVNLPSREVSVVTHLRTLNIENKMRTGQEYRKEERKKLSDRENEESQEDTSKNEYDEDFEADEEVNEEGQAGDQMNGMSKSSSDDKNHNLDYENESKNSSQKALQASDSEEDESDSYSDSDSEDEEQDGRPAHALSCISTQHSSEDGSHAETMEDNIKGKEEYNIERASDNTAHAQYGNENVENELLGMEENWETFALEKEGTDEAEKAKPEDLTAREDAVFFHENVMAVQHRSPEVNGELKQAGSVESNIGEDGEENASTRRDDGEESLLVPLESNLTELEDSSEESSQSDEGDVFEDRKPVQEEIAKAIGNDHHVNSEPEPSDSCADEEEENITSTERDADEAPDGAFLAEGTRTLDVQKTAERVVQEGQMVGERQALEKEDFVAEGGDACTEESGEETAWVGYLLPKEDTVARLQAEGQLAVEESAPEESAMAEEDPKGKGTGKGMESGTEVAPGEQAVLMEGRESEEALGEQAPWEEESAGALMEGMESEAALGEQAPWEEESAGALMEGMESEEALGEQAPWEDESAGALMEGMESEEALGEQAPWEEESAGGLTEGLESEEALGEQAPWEEELAGGLTEGLESEEALGEQAPWEEESAGALMEEMESEAALGEQAPWEEESAEALTEVLESEAALGEQAPWEEESAGALMEGMESEAALGEQAPWEDESAEALTEVLESEAALGEQAPWEEESAGALMEGMESEAALGEQAPWEEESAGALMEGMENEAALGEQAPWEDESAEALMEGMESEAALGEQAPWEEESAGALMEGMESEAALGEQAPWEEELAGALMEGMESEAALGEQAPWEEESAGALMEGMESEEALGEQAPWEEESAGGLTEVLESEAALGEQAPWEEESAGALMEGMESEAALGEQAPWGKESAGALMEGMENEAALGEQAPWEEESAEALTEVLESEAALGEQAPQEEESAEALTEGLESEAALGEQAPLEEASAEALMEGMESEAALGEQAPWEEESAGALMEGMESEAALGEQAPLEQESAGALMEGMESEAALGEQAPWEEESAGALMEGMESEAALGEQAPWEEESAGALLGREADGAVSEGEEVAGEVSEGEEAVEEASEAKEAVGETGLLLKEVVGEMVSEAEEAVEEGGFAGEGIVAGAVSEGEEAVEDTNLAEEGIAGVVGPEGEEPVEEAVSEGEEAVEKPGALLETVGDMEVCTGEEMPGGEEFVKPNEFSQLKVSGEEWMEMGKAAIGARTSETGEASEVEGSSLLSAEDAVEESVEPGKGPVLQVTPELEALVDAGGDSISEGSSQLEDTTTEEEEDKEEEEDEEKEEEEDEEKEVDEEREEEEDEDEEREEEEEEDREDEEKEEDEDEEDEEGSAEALLSGSPSLGSKAETESAMEEKPDGGLMGESAEIARAESGGGEEFTGGAAGPRELAAGMEGSLECAEERGKERSPGERVVPAPGLSVSRAGEAGVVAGAVAGSQAGPGALDEGAAGEPTGEAAGQEVVVAGDGGMGDGAVAQEGVTGPALGGQSGMGAAALEGVSAEGRGAASESGRDREGVADGAVACGQGVNQEAVLGCEGRGPALAGAEGQDEVEWEWDTARLESPWHGEPCGAMFLGEQPIAETSQSTPAHEDGGPEPRGRGSTGGEGLCLGTLPQLAPPRTGAVEGKDGLPEGTEQAGVKAEGEQPGLCENTREREVVGVLEHGWCASGVREQREISPVGGSPDTLGAADVDLDERSHSPLEDVVNPDEVVVSPVQLQDGEETLL